ncbi:MAG TPA: LptE family protein [Acidobacteriaceae bacterium]|jgi:outer membrane lipopolysaccharide assembly protein LptE/RlpB|nr:LptE family protein [Acidobacteriaceae bacterium]
MRSVLVFLCALSLCITGCGYHTAGAATHLPPDLSSIAVPIFQTRVQNYHTEVAFTKAVIDELTSRTNYHVISSDHPGAADATLFGTILTEVYTPLTYNSQTGQSSSYLITITAKVVLTDNDGKVLYQNSNYLFRQQYQSTQDLTSFIQEDGPAVHRLAHDFSEALVGDILNSF